MDKRWLRVVLTTLLVLGATMLPSGVGWAQQAASSMPATESAAVPGYDWQAARGLATAAAIVGSFFYASFKAAVICPGMALASGASLALTRGDKPTAEYLLRVGCTGTYFVTPDMVRGREEFQGSGSR